MDRLKYLIRLFVPLVLISLGFQEIMAQDLEKLREERAMQMGDIAYTDSLLNQTAAAKKNELNQLQLLNKQIKSRAGVIRNISSELHVLERSITQKSDSVENLREEVERMKAEYARMIYKAYQTRKSYDKAQYVLAASDFNQAYKRMKYMQQYGKFRKEQANRIKEKTDNINEQLSKLEKAKERQRDLLNQSQREVAKLNNTKNDQNKVVQNLSKQERQLRKELRDKKKVFQRIESEIQRILTEAMNKNKTGTGMELTPEMKIISNEFSQNKGRIPWPVARGVITMHYGKQTHPVLKKVTINNTGIDITTENKEPVRTVFAGKVKSIIPMKGANIAIIIQHGEFFSVYQNLVSIRVKVGDIVAAKDIIGIAFGPNDGSNSEVHFEIWKAGLNLNPEKWLAK